MASEAQRLIGISLTKIAQSRSHRGGVSLHKNLLVATVLQKARYIFMEEAYNMVHYHAPVPVQVQTRPAVTEEQDLVGLTAEEAGLESSKGPPDELHESSQASEDQQEFLQLSCIKCNDNQHQDKENLPPCNNELTYLDLDKASHVLKEKSNSSLKRRRAVAEWETEEAVQSILPKKSRQSDDDSSDGSSGSDSDSSCDDSVFLDDATLLSGIVSKEVEAGKCHESSENNGNAMEIDRITSLVSIFSFSMGGGDSSGKLNRSMSTPDLCSAQAKDCPDSIQQRPFLAMTV